MNSITIYIAQRFIPFGTIARNVFGGVAGLLPKAGGNLLISLANMLICWLFLFFLYRKNVFLRV